MDKTPSPRSRFAVALGLAGIVACSGAVAATAGALPPSHEQNGIWYLSGGYGCHEAAAIRSVAASYPLSLSFYAQGAQRRIYLAKVQVTILDAQGATVLQTEAEGPLLLVRLPAGRYRIDTRYKDQQRSAEVLLREGGHRELAFALHDEAADSALAPQSTEQEREVCA